MLSSAVALARPQEDSLWPLSDAKTLKDKFDDIFAATRYTKALENIHKLRKEKTTEIKLLEADLKVLEASLEQAHKVRMCTRAGRCGIGMRQFENASLLGFVLNWAELS